MRDAKRFVQIHVAHIRTDFGGIGHAHLRVQVRAVHVHLTPVLMHDGANFFHRLFKHAVR